jgi:heterodisulfide reductase subunit C
MKTVHPESVIVPDHNWLAEVEKKSGVKVSACYQCKKCSAGCPVTFAMDYLPNQMLHMIQIGLKEEVLKSATIWVCASCETCTTRCPNDIDIAKIMDAMRMASLKSGVAAGEKRVPIFHEAFLSSVKSTGRVYELGMIGQYTLKSGDAALKLKEGSLLGEAKLGWQMFKKGKLKLFPQRIKGTGEIKKLFKKTKRGEGA